MRAAAAGLRMSLDSLHPEGNAGNVCVVFVQEWNLVVRPRVEDDFNFCIKPVVGARKVIRQNYFERRGIAEQHGAEQILLRVKTPVLLRRIIRRQKYIVQVNQGARWMPG